MNQCPHCGKEFEGNFCPACGFTLVSQKQPSNHTASAWIRARKKRLGWIAAALVVALVLAVTIPLAIVNRHNGTYYLYENGAYNYEKYFVFKGNTCTDELGYSCDLKFDGNQVELRVEVYGMTNVAVRGTIEEDIVKFETLLGAEIIAERTYAKEGR